ncbi:uncharacterized protein [Watersipora subatra]|uniref:uncharacterized protein isoform X2 n=1 Tax=Watersipora subatra TaxID=2589382 RepID=UPI00355BE4D8
MKRFQWILSASCVLYLAEAEMEEGSRCIFPFKYKGKNYSTCIPNNHTQLWCATTPDYDRDEKWRECIEQDLLNPPVFDPSLATNITVTRGGNATLPCVIKNLLNRQITWQKVGLPFPLTVADKTFISDERFSVQNPRSDEWNLVIRLVTNSDMGVYQCKIVTRTLSLVREVTLNIRASRDGPILTTMTQLEEGLTFHELRQGESLQIACNTTNVGYRRGQLQYVDHNLIIWYKDGQMVDSNTKTGILIVNNVKDEVARSELHIENVNKKDAGIYACISKEKTIAKFNVNLKRSDLKMPGDQPPREDLLKKEMRNRSSSIMYLHEHQVSLILSLTLFVHLVQFLSS